MYLCFTNIHVKSNLIIYIHLLKKKKKKKKNINIKCFLALLNIYKWTIKNLNTERCMWTLY